MTPYLRPWHIKKDFGSVEQIREECRRRGLPVPTEIAPREKAPVRAAHFHRFRLKRSLTPSAWRMSPEMSSWRETMRGGLMKRSRAIRLVLLGGAGCALAACDQAPPPDARFFADAEACAAVHDQGTCRQALAESEATFAAEAPRYSRKEECEAEFGAGNCETRQSGGFGSFFMPMMMGYMLGSAFRQPVYRGPDDRAMVRSGGTAYDVGRFTGTGRASSFQPAQITQVRRGGFGATASSHRATAGG